MPEVHKSLEIGEVRLVELIKRVTVGLVVATFLFGILRYLAGLYRAHYDEMVIAQREEILVRKFYIAFKGCEGSRETQSQIAIAFMRGIEQAGASLSKSTDSDTKDKVDFIKELLELVSKKMG